MRKNLIQCCLAVLIAPVLTFMLIGTIALAASGQGGYSLTVNTTAATLEKDGTATLTATVTNSSGNVSNPSISWSTSSNAISLSGTSGSSVTVTANEVSQDTEVTITASCAYTYTDASSAAQSDTMTETCTITVKAPVVTSPTLDRIEATFAPLSLKVGETRSLPTPEVTAYYDDNTTQKLTSGYTVGTASSDDTSIATVGSGNQVTGAGVGSTTVTVPVTCDGKSHNAICSVSVTAEPVTSITITRPVPGNEGVVSMSPGERQPVTVVHNPSSAVVTWSSTDSSVATVRDGNIVAVNPGEATLTASAGDKKAELKVVVAGFKLKANSFTVAEHGSIPLADIFDTYGPASFSDLRISTSNRTVAVYLESTGIVGESAGTATFTVSSTKGGTFNTEFTVTVEPDKVSTIDRTGRPLKIGDTLSFSDLYSDFRAQAGGELDHIIGLAVDSTQKGTLYYKYQSEAQNGLGVGDSTYYLSPSYGQRGISDITFVPKKGFTGGRATISYTAVSRGGQNYSCKILLSIDPGEGAAAGITLSTPYNTAVKFSGSEFNQVCRDETRADLDYVVFSLPPVRQGSLYTNYVREGNYGTAVSPSARYDQKALNDVWFVPAPGYEGTVTVYYTAHGKGSSSNTYNGCIYITVGRDSSVANGGLSYDVSRGGVARFNDEDFRDYCQDILDDRQNVSFIRFDSLPAASEGVLYYDYRSSASPGSRASAGTSYYYGTRSPRIDRLVFVPTADFIGTVRLPFTGETADGTRFAGNVEVNVRGGTGTGDIYYTCAPGRSVSFNDSDFNRLCREVTNSGLNYIEFQGLPNSSDGTLYYNSSAARTDTRYYNGSSTPRIDNLSFRAGSRFSGTVDIAFVGYNIYGSSFQGVVTIGTSSSGGSGSIRYTADAKNAAVFDRDDFDGLSWDETREYVNTVRFKLPSASQGTLYRGYRSASSMGTRITTSNYSVSASALDQVAFVPASGYTGTVYLEFTATALNNGGTFDGTVEVEVGRAPADVTVSYTTRNSAPVRFSGGDFGRRGYTLSSIRFTEVPPASAGYLYYQYTSPTRSGRQAGTGTSYRPSGNDLISDLTFVPRAGFTGTVTIPYTGTNSNNSTFEGEVVINVSPSYSSSYFSDMSGYSDAQRAAVDFLYDHNITRGLTATQYGPENSIRRGDFARMLYQAFELSPTGSSGAFRDVPSGAYYAEAVDALYARGIVSGIGNGYYAPDSTLTRQDALCMVQRAMRSMSWNASDGSAGSLYSYSDGSDVSAYAQGAVSFAVQRGYLPTSGGRLNPTQALTRVDMAEIIHRVLTY